MANVIITETFIEYAIGMVFLMLRMFARLKFSGLRGLQIDDAFTGGAMVCLMRPRSLKKADDRVLSRFSGLFNLQSFIS